jgi:hypothetical protein
MMLKPLFLLALLMFFPFQAFVQAASHKAAKMLFIAKQTLNIQLLTDEELLYDYDQATRFFLRAHKAKSIEIEQRSDEHTLLLRFCITPAENAAGKVMYIDLPFNRPLQVCIKTATIGVSSELRRTLAGRMPSAFRGYYNHSLALRVLQKTLQQKLLILHDEKRRQVLLVLLQIPLLHLIAIADKNRGAITGTIDLLLYLAILEWLESPEAAAA